MPLNFIVTVRSGNLERALRILKRGLQRTGVVAAMRRHEARMTPGERRRLKSRLARKKQARAVRRAAPYQEPDE